MERFNRPECKRKPTRKPMPAGRCNRFPESAKSIIDNDAIRPISFGDGGAGIGRKLMLDRVVAALLAVAGGAAVAGAEPAGQNKTTTGGDPDQTICRQAEPVLGSRVARRRICRTRAQWQAFEEDRQQLRRDLQNAARDVPRQ
jgi:hypothetical protein